VSCVNSFFFENYICVSFKAEAIRGAPGLHDSHRRDSSNGWVHTSICCWNLQVRRPSSFFFIKRYLYYTKRHTNTKRSPYRNLLDAYRRDTCTHKLTQMTLKEKKITTESLGSLVLVETAVRLHRRRSPRPRRTPRPKKNKRTPKASRSSIARRR